LDSPIGTPPGPASATAHAVTGSRPVYFIADAHLGALDGPADAVSERELEQLIESLSGSADHVYLVGDIFDFWFEYRAPSRRGHEAVLSALARLTASGTPVTFLGGNHDYWAGPEFETLSGAAVVRDPIVVTHFGRRIFIAHGDGLPAGDWGYRILKSVIRNPGAIALFRLLSPSFGGRIAVHVSDISGVTEDRVRRAIPPMRDFLLSRLGGDIDAAIVGHVHAPRLWERDGRTAIIVGDWMTNRAVASLDATGFRMLRWRDGALVPNDDARAAAPGV
jgi:UDP-2,3-diacylglucosamine hydrolase